MYSPAAILRPEHGFQGCKQRLHDEEHIRHHVRTAILSTPHLTRLRIASRRKTLPTGLLSPILSDDEIGIKIAPADRPRLPTKTLRASLPAAGTSKQKRRIDTSRDAKAPPASRRKTKRAKPEPPRGVALSTAIADAFLPPADPDQPTSNGMRFLPLRPDKKAKGLVSLSSPEYHSQASSSASSLTAS